MGSSLEQELDSCETILLGSGASLYVNAKYLPKFED